jgi:hypothetical protein
MVAVRCSHCGTVHAREGDFSSSARPGPGRERALVVDVPSKLATPAPRLERTVYRPPAALPRARPGRPLVQLIEQVINRPSADLPPGTRVAVRNRFNGRWAPGFAVHEVLETGYRVRREHKGAVLPTVFLRTDVAADGYGAAASVRDLRSSTSRRTTTPSPSNDTSHPRISTPVMP